MKITFEPNVENVNNMGEALVFMREVRKFAKPGTLTVTGPTRTAVEYVKVERLRGAKAWEVQADIVVSEETGDTLKRRCPPPEDAADCE